MSTDTIIALIGLVVTILGGIVVVVRVLAKIDPIEQRVSELVEDVQDLRDSQSGVVSTAQQASATTVSRAHTRIDELVHGDLVAIRASVGQSAQQVDMLRMAVEHQSRELEKAVNAVQQLLLADRERSVEHNALVDKVERDITEGRERQRAIADLDARLRVQEARR